MEKECKSSIIRLVGLLFVGSICMNGAMTVAPKTFQTERSFNHALTGDREIAEETLNCKFVIEHENQPYTCQVENLDYTTDVEITSVTGTHLPGKSNADVQVIDIKSGNMFALPKGIHKFFPNLDTLFVGGESEAISLKNIKRPSLSKLSNLRNLYIYTTELNHLDDDAFWDLSSLFALVLSLNGGLTLQENVFKKNTNLVALRIDGAQLEGIPATLLRSNLKLEVVYFENCSLTSVDESLFDTNTRLMGAVFGSNRLEFLPKDFFKNTPLLRAVDFSGNLLKIIEVDFTKFNVLVIANFNDNVCINAYYDRENGRNYKYDEHFTDVIAFQNAITANCSQSRPSVFSALGNFHLSAV